MNYREEKEKIYSCEKSKGSPGLGDGEQVDGGVEEPRGSEHPTQGSCDPILLWWGGGATVLPREYWMFHRGPCIPSDVWFVSQPLSRQQVVSLSQFSCVSPVERVGSAGGQINEIIRQRDRLVLSKSFNTLHRHLNKIQIFEGQNKNGNMFLSYYANVFSKNCNGKRCKTRKPCIKLLQREEEALVKTTGQDLLQQGLSVRISAIFPLSTVLWTTVTNNLKSMVAVEREGLVQMYSRPKVANAGTFSTNNIHVLLTLPKISNKPRACIYCLPLSIEYSFIDNLFFSKEAPKLLLLSIFIMI